MKEIEVKILEIDPEAIKKKLQELGAEKVFAGEMTSFAFDYPDGRIIAKGELLRLRQEGDKAVLCYKSDAATGLDYKVMEEIKTEVSDFNSMQKILEKAGLRKVRDYSKKRESYQIDNIRFEIDVYPGIPALVEVEAPTKQDVEKGVGLLGFSMEDSCTLNTHELFKKYKGDANE